MRTAFVAFVACLTTQPSRLQLASYRTFYASITRMGRSVWRSLNTSAGYLLVTWFRLSDKNVVADIYVVCACYIRLGEGIMVYRQLKRRETAVIEQSESQLSEEQVAALIRQSSTRQVLENVESADIQLTGAQKFAVSQGLNAGKIMIMH
jgi:hypothetical protein